MKRFKQTVKYLFYKPDISLHNFFRSLFAALAAKKCDYGGCTCIRQEVFKELRDLCLKPAAPRHSCGIERLLLAQPNWQYFVIGEHAVRIGMYQHIKSLAIEHEPRHKAGEAFNIEANFKHRAWVRANCSIDHLRNPERKLRRYLLIQHERSRARRIHLVVDMRMKPVDFIDLPRSVCNHTHNHSF